VGGVILVAAGFYTASLPTIYRSSSFWTTSPTYFAIRVGAILLSLAAAAALLPLARWVPGPFDVAERFGRRSLFVYWIHVDLVYGYATWGIHRRLPLWGTVVAYALFCALMYGAIALRGRLTNRWRDRQQLISNVIFTRDKGRCDLRPGWEREENRLR
jgi:hypothetical protein